MSHRRKSHKRPCKNLPAWLATCYPRGVTLTVIMMLTLVPGVCVGELPDFAWYQVDLGGAALSAEDAISTFQQRRRAVLVANACSRDLEFSNALNRRNDAGLPDGDIASFLIAKIVWAADQPTEPCDGKITYYDTDLEPQLELSALEPDSGPDTIAQRALVVTEKLQVLFGSQFGDQCRNTVRGVAPRRSIYAGIPRTAYEINFSISNSCILDQVSKPILTRTVASNAGTSGLPCRLTGNAGPGDWDMAVIGYVRALYLNRKAEQHRAISPLDANAKAHILNNLLSLSGRLEPESYPLSGCGNQERDIGSPEERVSEFEADEEGFFDDLGDFLEWFLRRMLAPLQLAAGVVMTTTPVYFVSDQAGWDAFIESATPIMEQVHIPETENHLLMINTSKYLTNRLILDKLNDEDDRELMEDIQKELKEWLLKRLNRITSEDFIEYNSRPYQRLSIGAIMNLHDFADDDDLKTAAKIVLEFASAKFAVASSQGRRIVPFRRLMEVVRNDLCVPASSIPCPENASMEGAKAVRLFDLYSGADHQIAAMLMYAGQTQHLPSTPEGVGRLASIHGSSEMMWQATSTYFPSRPTLRLAIEKRPFDQRFHHDGYESYSNGKGFVLSAGGVQTAFPYGMLQGPIEMRPPFNFKLKNTDRGAGVPTILFAASGNGHVRRQDFLRYEGRFSERDPDEDNKRNLTNDHNLCVRRGLACGTNLRIPAAIEACITRMAPTRARGWSFIDSTRCDAYRTALPFFVAVFQEQCLPNRDDCNSDWGFFEAVDRPAVSFDEFINRTLAANLLSANASPAQMTVTYRSWWGEVIDLDVNAHVDDSDRSGIERVNGIEESDIEDWNLASGDAIRADGDGVYTIRVPGETTGARVEADFSDWEQPKYQELF